MNKKIIATVAIIIIALILLIVGGGDKGREDEILPTRDVDGIEGYASIEEFCAELTASQEFDDTDRDASFYETCLLEYR